VIDAIVDADQYVRRGFDAVYNWLNDWFSISRKTAVRGFCVVYIGGQFFDYFVFHEVKWFDLLTSLLFIGMIDSEPGRVSEGPLVEELVGTILSLARLFFVGLVVGDILRVLFRHHQRDILFLVESIAFLFLLYRRGKDNDESGKKRREALGKLSELLGGKQHLAPAVGMN